MTDYIRKIVAHVTSQVWMYAGLLFGIVVIFKFILRGDLVYGVAIACLPVLFIVVWTLIKNPYWSFLLLFTANYFVMGVNRYISLKGGVCMLVLLLFLFFVTALRGTYLKLNWDRSETGLTLAWFIWLVYCVLEVVNPNGLFSPWSISIMGYAINPFLIVLLVPILVDRYKDVKWVLVLWATFTFLAAMKGYWQRNRGFDSTELNWLFNEGGASTHLIYTGIRFFSFFTDAANFGSSMGFSLVVFGISSFYMKSPWLRFYFLLAAFASGYGLVISGTRSSMAVPFVGFLLFFFFSRRWKVIIPGGILMLFLFVFFNNTTIGDGNRLVKRMRSAFDFNDPSFQVRLRNQELLKKHMADKFFGVGLGMGGGKAKRFAPEAYTSQVATDSWLVMTWVETGIVGLVLYLLLHLYIIGRGAYLVMYRVRNRELQGVLTAMLAGVCGMMVSSYGNEILSFPNGILVYTCEAFIFTGIFYDQELSRSEHETI